MPTRRRAEVRCRAHDGALRAQPSLEHSSPLLRVLTVPANVSYVQLQLRLKEMYGFAVNMTFEDGDVSNSRGHRLCN